MAYPVTTHTPLLQDTDSDSEGPVSRTGTPTLLASGDPGKPLFRAQEPVVDRYYLCYGMFYLLGITSLLPWNFFITADDYWMYKFRNVQDNSTRLQVTPASRTPLQKEFTSYLSIASAVPNTVFLILSTIINRKVALSLRMFGSLFVIIVFFIVTTVFVLVDTDQWQHEFFLLTMATVVILNIACAILAGSVFGVVGQFSPAYITAVISGQALGGVFTALVQILALATGESSSRSALLYFLVGIGVLLATLAAYAVLSRAPFFRCHVHAATTSTSTMGSIQAAVDEAEQVSYGAILDRVWVYGVSEWLVFVVTLSVYPGVTVLIEAAGKGSGDKWSDLYFVPVISYLVFSLGDYIGRLLAGYLQWPRQKGPLLLALNVIRLAFIPLLLLCNAQPRHHLPVLIRNDVYYVLVMCAFSLSNGYLANIAIICAPRAVEQHERETASTMMAAFLGVGLSMGSIISLLMVKLL